VTSIYSFQLSGRVEIIGGCLACSVLTGRRMAGLYRSAVVQVGVIRLEAEGDWEEDSRSVNAIGALRRPVKLLELIVPMQLI
jgi:hypothetical protein